ncbi:hypothetical protein E2C01_038281 [Portunus trituberculatus]|uniref:Uncharacterized protein n=1 Tax=Portunus trituberculatus TaxID=210409 RepID=A0A5B7FJK0_PORTR|nr:hypothetical protein [Portunus trituberculatus]
MSVIYTDALEVIEGEGEVTYGWDVDEEGGRKVDSATTERLNRLLEIVSRRPYRRSELELDPYLPASDKPPLPAISTPLSPSFATPPACSSSSSPSTKS